MKHFRLLPLLLGFWLLAGCTADPTSESTSSPPEPAISENSHAVPVEQALEELQSLLETIDAPTEDGVITRSGGERRDVRFSGAVES